MTQIPSHAKKVFQGTIFAVHQWEQTLYDGSHATFEALSRPGTIQIIATQHDSIVLSYEEQPTKPLAYSFLGGRQELHEDPLMTAKRELLEEAGMVSDDWELFKIYNAPGKIHWEIYLFIAKNCTKTQEPQPDPGEKITVKKVSFETFLDIVCSEKFLGQSIANDVLRMRLDPQKLEAFKQRLFS